MSEKLCSINGLGEVLPINSNEENFCGQCGVTITEENNSGWQHFTSDGVTTQKSCKKCDKEMDTIKLKNSV